MSKIAVTAVERVLDIVEAFRAARRPLSLTELATAVKTPKSSCHAIVATLLSRGYLYTLSRPRALYPTRRLHDLSREILEHDPFIEQAMPLLTHQVLTEVHLTVDGDARYPEFDPSLWRETRRVSRPDLDWVWWERVASGG